MPTIALFTWPLVSLVLFARLPLQRAVLVSLLAGYLLLPERFGIDLPGLPPFDKLSTILLGLLAGLFFFSKSQRNGTASSLDGLENHYRALGFLMLGAIALMLVNTLLTMVTNRAPLVYGPVVLPGLSIRDVISMVTSIVIITTPFVIGLRFLSQPESHRLILRCLVFAALAYAVLIWIEIRFSPQMHRWIYGYHQHSFIQHIRGGVFRPKVFLEHGLSVGFFLFSACLASMALFFTAPKERKMGRLIIFGLLFLTLVSSRNLGAVGLLLFFIPIFWLKQRIQLLFITGVTVIFLLYPAVRQMQILPLNTLYEISKRVSVERADSLQFRFDNEDRLLAHALKKPFSGWGGWNRSRVFDEEGRDISATDGLWIIRLGSYGWFGYIGFFSLLAFPLLFLRGVRKRKEIPTETLAIGLVMTGNLIYIVPNAFLSPFAWLLAGALAGFVQYDPKPGSTSASVAGADDLVQRRENRYTRFPHR